MRALGPRCASPLRTRSGARLRFLRRVTRARVDAAGSSAPSPSLPPSLPPTHPPSLPPSFARSPAPLLFSSPPYRGLNRDAAGTDPSAGGEVLLVRTSIPRSMSTLTRSSRRNASSLSCPSQLDCRRNQRAVDKPFDICCADASTSSFRDVTSFLLDQSPQ